MTTKRTRPVNEGAALRSIVGRTATAAATPPHLKGLFYGPPGSGKTTLLATMGPKGLILDVDGGAPPIVAALPEAERPEVFRITSVRDVDDAIYTLAFEDHGWDTVALDTVTTMQNIVADEVGLIDVINANGDPRRKYGDIAAIIRHKLTLMLKLDMNVILTAHLRDSTDGEVDIEEGKYPVVPDIQPSVARVALAYPDVIGRMYLKEHNGKIVHAVAFGKDPRSFQKQRALGLPDEVSGSSLTIPKLVERVTGGK